MGVMKTSTYPFGIDHENRDLVRVRTELNARSAPAWRPERRLGLSRRRRPTPPDDLS